jgi:hypothetical protein
VRKLAFAIGILFALSIPLRAQNEPNGTWRIETIGNTFVWDVFLRADGSKISGVVSNCAPNRSVIVNGKTDGNRISFECVRADGASTLTFDGRLNGDEIVFTWGHRDRNGTLGPRPDHPLSVRTLLSSL